MWCKYSADRVRVLNSIQRTQFAIFEDLNSHFNAKATVSMKYYS